MRQSEDYDPERLRVQLSAEGLLINLKIYL